MHVTLLKASGSPRSAALFVPLRGIKFGKFNGRAKESSMAVLSGGKANEKERGRDIE